MKRRLLILALLFCAPAMWGALMPTPMFYFGTCTATATGTWKVGGTATFSAGCSGTGGIPVAGDTITTISTGVTLTVNDTEAATAINATSGSGQVVVASGGTLTWNTMSFVGTGGIDCQSGSVCNFGSNTATTNTIDGTLGLNTFFKSEAGSTFNWNGSIQGSGAIIWLNGHSLCTPNGSVIYQSIQNGNYTNTAGQLGLLQIRGASHASPAIFDSAAGGAANCGITRNNVTTKSSSLDIAHAIFNNCGYGSGTTFYCWNFPVAVSLASQDIEDVLINQYGRWVVSTDAGDGTSSTFYMNAVDFRNPSVVPQTVLFNSPTANVPANPYARIMTNVTCYVGAPGASTGVFTFNLNSTHVGLDTNEGDASDTPGWVAHNCPLTANSAFSPLNKFTNGYSGDDSTADTASVYMLLNSNSLVRDSLFFNHHDNFHTIGQGGSSAGLGNNQVKYNVVDGGNYVVTDNGEFCSNTAAGPMDCTFNLVLNGAQNLAVSQNTGPQLVEHNTTYNQASIDSGDTGVLNTAFNSMQYNLFGKSWTAGNPGCVMRALVGISQTNSSNGFASQTALVENFNGYYGITNSGDIGAPSCTVGATGIGTPYVGGLGFIGVPLQVRGGLSAKTLTGSGGGVITCPTCNFNQGGGSPCTLINTAGSDVCVIAGDIIWDNTTKGVGVVTSNPGTGTTLNYTLLGGTIGNTDSIDIRKSWQNPGYQYGSNAAFGLNDVHASPNHFNPDNYVCEWYNLATGAGLNCALESSSGSVVDTVSQAMVTINGWDYGTASSLTGTTCTANCPAPVTPSVASHMAAVKTLRQWYTPYNGMFSNTDCRTQPCQWTGAQRGYPAAIISSN